MPPALTVLIKNHVPGGIENDNANGLWRAVELHARFVSDRTDVTSGIEELWEARIEYEIKL
jgi:hypothetical protein